MKPDTETTPNQSADANAVGSNDLLACPFCGSKKDVEINSFNAQCNNCGASAGEFCINNQARQAWNRRSPDERLVKALHDAISRPMGVVPASAEQFYDPDFYKANA